MEAAWDEWLRVVPSDEPRTRSAFEAGWRAAITTVGAAERRAKDIHLADRRNHDGY